MNDKQSAAIVVAIAAIAFLIWYRRQPLSGRATLFGETGPATPESRGDASVQRPRGVPVLPQVGGFDPAKSPLQRLMEFTDAWGLKISPNPTGGKHVEGSYHYKGRAVDVRTRGVALDTIEDFIAAARRSGFRVLDERVKKSRYWTGPHLHVEDRR
jgi:hypothetical protein